MPEGAAYRFIDGFLFVESSSFGGWESMREPSAAGITVSGYMPGSDPPAVFVIISLRPFITEKPLEEYRFFCMHRGAQVTSPVARVDATCSLVGRATRPSSSQHFTK